MMPRYFVSFRPTTSTLRQDGWPQPSGGCQKAGAKFLGERLQSLPGTLSPRRRRPSSATASPSTRCQNPSDPQGRQSGPAVAISASVLRLPAPFVEFFHPGTVILPLHRFWVNAQHWRRGPPVLRGSMLRASTEPRGAQTTYMRLHDGRDPFPPPPPSRLPGVPEWPSSS